MKIKTVSTQFKQTQKGFTFVEIMIVTGLIALLATLAVPNFFRARSAAQEKACIENMRQIETAKQTWALETAKNNGNFVLALDLVPSYIQATPVCPANGTYDYKTVGEGVVCETGGVTTPGHIH